MIFEQKLAAAAHRGFTDACTLLRHAVAAAQERSLVRAADHYCHLLATACAGAQTSPIQPSQYLWLLVVGASAAGDAPQMAEQTWQGIRAQDCCRRRRAACAADPD